MKYLLIGPRYQQRTSQIGGTTVSFETLIKYFLAQQEHIECVQTNTFKKRNLDLLNYIRVFFLVMGKAARKDIIMFNCSPRGFVGFAPLIYILKKLWNKKIVLRPFGGKFEEYFHSCKGIEFYLLNKSLSCADLLCLQTKKLMDANAFCEIKKYWLPTSRDFSKCHAPRNEYRKRFVFISQIHKQKGIDLIINLKKLLPANYTLDVFGPILDSNYDFLKKESFYKETLSPENIIDTLEQYDVLIFPSTYPGEGYPGVIIESFVSAMPVIAMDWLSIPELIVDRSNGILIHPDAPGMFLDEILAMNELTYREMSREVVSRRLAFDQEIVNKKLLDCISNL